MSGYIGQPSDQILEWRDQSVCPKCDEGRLYINAMVRYSVDFDTCHCSRGIISGEHLELTCFKCGYVQPMKTKDWKEPPPPPPKIEWNEDFPPPPTDR